MTSSLPRSRGRSNGTSGFALADGARINGFVDEGYGLVMDAFVANFAERCDVGAGCVAYVEGRPVVDLWGGIADRRVGRQWTRDTSAVIFSCTKGVLAICVYMLKQEGRLDLDVPIATYWPDFGRNGKEAITLRDAMSHRAGIPCLDADLTRNDVLSWDPVIRGIEAQSPRCQPDDGHIYHAMTYGWLLGEAIRRVTGLMPGRYLREAITDPRGLDTWIGLPENTRSSVAWMEAPLPDEDSEDARAVALVAETNPVVERSLTMGGAFAFPADGEFVTFNDAAFQAAEIPGANGISTARSLARLYASCVSEIDGPRLLSDASIEDAMRVCSEGPQLSGMPDDGGRWGTGFQLASPPSQPMLGAGSFGHAGAGGQLGFADVDHRVGFAYLSNQMGGYGDARARELTVALSSVLGA